MTVAVSRTKHRVVGFTLIEVVIIMVVVGAMLALAIPRLNLQRYRTDSAIQGLRSVLMQAQRTALVRQYDVVISIDTAGQALQWWEDANNDGIIEPSEHTRTYPLNDAVRFVVPPIGVNGSVSSAVVGSHLGTLNGLPSITFTRDGEASTNLELYVAGPADPNITYRAVLLTQASGRTDFYLYNAQANSWKLGGLQ